MENRASDGNRQTLPADRRRRRARVCVIVITSVAVLVGAGLAYHYWPRELPLAQPRPLTPVVEFGGGTVAVRMPGRVLVADVATFDDELYAYLMGEYLRSLFTCVECRAWLTYERRDKALLYVIRVGLADNLLAGAPSLFRLRKLAWIDDVPYRWVTPDVASRYEGQSALFDRAYGRAVRRPLEGVPRGELAAYLRRFIRFKAATDGRINRGIEPVPNPPTRREAHRLAEDIITVADFYSLPLDFFLGIGAMENNYMHVKGDLGNAIWKRRAERGDVVLKRGAKGVLVLNESSGIWQITRETLRYAHRLYLKDTRDYSVLPEHLRPPKALDVNDVPPEVLTTYAGLFFRDLLDAFRGDVALAVGAYNGGPRNPNPEYEAGVRMVAEYARRVLEHAATLQGRTAVGLRRLTN
jgi:hypothetical protein